jgi:cytochrome c oxidase subunit 3
MSSSNKNHPFHLVDPSPWPFMISMALLVLSIGAVFAMRGIDYILFIIGLITVLGIMGAWFFDVIKESRQKNIHTPAVQQGLRMGFILFILSELMLFFAFFWSYFNAAFNPIIFLNEQFIQGVWPPAGIKTLDPFDLPYLNTLILLLSATTLTWSHHALLKDNVRDTRIGLFLTVLLGVTFTVFQIGEYAHTAFKFKDGIYPTTFFMATGLHGFHVIVGTITLFICFLRTFKKNDMTSEHHVGFETAVWYWHFVDIVWIFLFFSIYWWGSGPA